MKYLLLTTLLLLSTTVHAQTVSSLSTVQIENDALYQKTQTAAVYSGGIPLKDYIRSVILAGYIPAFYADKIPLATFLNEAKKAYEDVGGNLFILNLKQIFVKVNLLHEIRLTAMKNGYTVDTLVAQSIKAI